MARPNAVKQSVALGGLVDVRAVVQEHACDGIVAPVERVAEARVLELMCGVEHARASVLQQNPLHQQLTAALHTAASAPQHAAVVLWGALQQGCTVLHQRFHFIQKVMAACVRQIAAVSVSCSLHLVIYSLIDRFLHLTQQTLPTG